jgi:3,4-dihydroxy 2-butanone 4-phosphate synthase
LSSYAKIISCPPVPGGVVAAELARRVPTSLEAAAAALAAGEPVLIFDAVDREGETDLVFLSEKATPELVRLARRDAGGLLCTAITEELRRRLGLPFVSELIEVGAARFPLVGRLVDRPRYDRRSARGLTVNHRSNYTGAPDNDRAVTIRALGELARDAGSLGDAELRDRFAGEFVSPGHVHLLYAARGLVAERKGHTELAVSLARMAGLSESATVCEMLGDSGGAREPGAARAYAREHGWEFLEGRTIAEAWKRWSSA